MANYIGSCTKKRWLIWCVPSVLIIIALAKLWLIADQEIIVALDDSFNYVKQADRLSDNFGLGATGYAVWLWVIKIFGVPQRLAIEILWLCSSSFFAFSVAPKRHQNWIVIPIFAVAAFAPQTLYLFDMALTDGFYLCMSVLAVALLVRVPRKHALKNRLSELVAIGLVVGLMTITRHEDFLLFTFLLFCFFGVGLYDWRTYKYQLSKSCLGAAGAFLIVCTVAVAVQAIQTLHNGWRYGVFTRTFVDMPSHMKVLKTLAAIETEEPNPRFVPITRKAREIAYAQSPTLSRFRSEIESPQNRYLQVSQKTLGFPGEIGAGFVWHVFNAAASSLGIKSLRELDTTYRQVVRELEEGFSEGKYRRRFVLHPFLGGDSAAWAPFLGEGLRHVVGCLLSPYGEWKDEDHQPSDREIFDRVCMRRLHLVSSSAHVQGWVFAKNSDYPVTGLNIESIGNEMQTLSELNPLPELQKNFQREGYAPPEKLGFNIFVPIEKFKERMPITFLSGSENVGRIETFGVNKVYVIPGLHGDLVVGFDVVDIGAHGMSSGLRTRIKSTILAMGSSSVVWKSGLFLCALCLLGLLLVKPLSNVCHYLMVAAASASWVLIHVCFYTLLSAAAWQAEPRYLQGSAFFCIFFMLINVLGFTCCLVDYYLIGAMNKISTISRGKFSKKNR